MALLADRPLLETMQTFHLKFLVKYVVIAVLALGSSMAFSQVSLSIGIAPPPLQVYTQPSCPGDGYIWTPGYWAYGDSGYYWVPGQWVQPPELGVYWTPPYWGWNGSSYAFNDGYWGPNVGYYGGINYGYGYGGQGYYGGRWQGSHFQYNATVNNIRTSNVHYTYAGRAATSQSASRVSYNGGSGGTRAQPTAAQRQVAMAHHGQPSRSQTAARTQSVPAVKPAAAEAQTPRVTESQPADHTPGLAERQPAAVTHAPEEVAPRPRPEAVAKAPSHLQPQVHAETHAAPGGAESHAQGGANKPQDH
jgi:hypothetical protein